MVITGDLTSVCAAAAFAATGVLQHNAAVASVCPAAAFAGAGILQHNGAMASVAQDSSVAAAGHRVRTGTFSTTAAAAVFAAEGVREYAAALVATAGSASVAIRAFITEPNRGSLAAAAGSAATAMDGVVTPNSGDYTNTTIEWVGSKTTGATYRIYDSAAVNVPINFNTVAIAVANPAAWSPATAYSPGDFVLPSTLDGYRYECTSGGTSGGTAPAWPGTLNASVADGGVIWTARRFKQKLGAIAQAAGERRVSVMAVAGGIEDGCRQQLAIEYDAAGNVVLPRPDAPTFIFQSAAQLTATVCYSQATTDEATPATHIRLRLKNEAGTITTFAPVALAASAPVRTGTLTGAAPAAGLYRYRLNALAGSVESSNTDWLGPVWLSDAVPAAPSNVEAVLR